MERYGGKFEKRREETRERLLREKDAFIHKASIWTCLVIWGITLGLLAIKYRTIYRWNDDIVFKTRSVWKAMDVVERDILNATLFLKGCRKDMVFQETNHGFDLHIVEMRNQSMEVLQNVEPYSDIALPAYLGSGIRPGDTLILCNTQEERGLQLQVIRNNPRWNFHYLIFSGNLKLSDPSLPSNLIKFKPVSYRWKQVAENNYTLTRTQDSMETDVLAGIQSYKIEYQFKDPENSFLSIQLVLREKFPDGQNIQVRRYIPLKSFARLPREMEGKVP